MNYSSRRNFIKTVGGLAAVGIAGNSFVDVKEKPLLSFSTLGCPDWSLTKIIQFAVANKYQGIELRGLQREMDLTKCKEFRNTESIQSTLGLMKDHDLRFVNLGSSAVLHVSEIAERTKNMDEAKRFIDLAQKLYCPFIRVFPDKLPKDRSRTVNLEIIRKGLNELGEYAKGTDVRVLMETHGELVLSSDIDFVMESSESKKIGLIWDIVNMWSKTKESSEQVYSKLKKYIHHIHIKDVQITNREEQYTLLGEGEAPIFEAIELLYRDGYKGYYSFEWEKLWHPEIPEPEIALPDYSIKMRNKYH